jgi:hypothetical protein
MSAIIILLGLFMVLVGLWFYKRHRDLKSVCTAHTTAQVIEMKREEEIKIETDDDGNTTKRTSVSYYPIFQYMVNGNNIEVRSSVGTGRPRFIEGQAVNVLYNPNKPEQFYVVEDKVAGNFGIYFIIFGLVVVIFGVVTIFVPLSVV